MIFQLYKNSYECFNESFAFLMWILIKLSLMAYSEMDENTLLTHVCADFTLSGMTVPCCHRRRKHGKATVEVSQRWNRWLTASLLASSASCFLIPWQKPSSHYCGTFPLIFQNFSWFQLLEEQKFSRENLHGFLKTAKIFSLWNLSFTVFCIYFLQLNLSTTCTSLIIVSSDCCV